MNEFVFSLLESPSAGAASATAPESPTARAPATSHAGNGRVGG